MIKPVVGAPILENTPVGVPLFRLAFRPLFLLGALFSIVSLILWSATLTGLIQPAFYGGPLWWHVHEMLFGFVTAIVAGFLLTAVQTWTGVPGIRGAWLAALVVLWLAARLGLLFSDAFAPWLVALVDLLFLPAVAGVMARSVVRVRQWRNILFVPVLLLMACANAVMHCSAAEADAGLLSRAAEAMVLLVTLLMTIVAGRVVPMFTANGTGTERVAALPWLERACLVSMVMALLAGTMSAWLPSGLVAAVFILAAILHGLRVLRWRLWVTLRTPLVWSLHLSYWSIPLGLSLFALSNLSAETVTRSQALHTLTVGGMGLMILAMISRVSLGHTGRPIIVGRLVAVAFLSVLAAFLLRVFGLYLISDFTHVVLASVACWSLGYGIFVLRYLPILTAGRIDGRPG